MKHTHTPVQKLQEAEAKTTDWSSFELKCMAQIKKNLQNIAQFRENSGRIGPILKAKFDKKVSELEQKNLALKLRMENFKTSRNAQLTEFNEAQENRLDKFRAEFNNRMKELV